MEYVYCVHGKVGGEPCKPFVNTAELPSQCAAYIQHMNDHFEPVGLSFFQTAPQLGVTKSEVCAILFV